MSKSAYRPNEAVLQALKQVRLVAVVGPSGSGKTTLVKHATEQDPDLHIVVSDVSRAQRPTEQQGIDYFFRTKQDMEAAIERQEYVQVAPSNSGDLYASHIESYSQKGLALMTIWAEAMPVFQQLPFKSLRTIFVVPPSFEQWQERFHERGFTAELSNKRLAEAEDSFAFGLAQPDVQFIINDYLETATADFIELAHGRSNDHLRKEQSRARNIIEAILSQLAE